MSYRQGQFPFNASVPPTNQRFLFSEDFLSGRGVSDFIPIPGFQNLPAQWQSWAPVTPGVAFLDANRRMGCVGAMPPTDPRQFDFSGAIARLPAIVVPSGAERLFEIQARVCFLGYPYPLGDGAPLNWQGPIFTGIMLSSSPLAPNADGSFFFAGLELGVLDLENPRQQASASFSKWIDSANPGPDAVSCPWSLAQAMYIRMRVEVDNDAGNYATEVQTQVSSDGFTWAILNNESSAMEAPNGPQYIGIASSGWRSPFYATAAYGGCDFLRMREIDETEFASLPLQPFGGVNWP